MALPGCGGDAAQSAHHPPAPDVVARGGGRNRRRGGRVCRGAVHGGRVPHHHGVDRVSGHRDRVARGVRQRNGQRPGAGGRASHRRRRRCAPQRHRPSRVGRAVRHRRLAQAQHEYDGERAPPWRRTECLCRASERPDRRGAPLRDRAQRADCRAGRRRPVRWARDGPDAQVRAERVDGGRHLRRRRHDVGLRVVVRRGCAAAGLPARIDLPDRVRETRVGRGVHGVQGPAHHRSAPQSEGDA
jgi:hypothetical protein